MDPPLILFVDDSLDARLTYSEYLLDAGFQVTTAADGNEGVMLALALVPRLVLLDLHMPGLDGWEAARLIRSYFPTRPIPIVALSGLRDDATVAQAMAAGCNHFVSKPCVPEELVRTIVSALTEQHGMKQRGVT